MCPVGAGLPRWFQHLPGILPSRTGWAAKDGRRQAGFIETGALQPVFWVTSSWSGDPVLPAQQTLHPQGLATICQGRHPWRANQATEWSRASPHSPAKRPLVLRVVFEDTVLNQKHSYPCSQSVRVREVPSVDSSCQALCSRNSQTPAASLLSKPQRLPVRCRGWEST